MDQADKLIGDQRIPLKQFLKKCWSFFKPISKYFILAIIFIIINVGFDIILPLFIEKIVDYLSINTEESVKTIIYLAIAYFGVTCVNQIFRFIEAYLLARAGNKVVYDMRVQTFEHIEKMSLDQFEVMPVGSLVTRVCSYTNQMSELFTNQLINLLRNAFMIIGVYTIMVVKNAKLSLIILGFAVVVFCISLFFRKIVSKLARAEKGTISDLNTIISEDLNGMKIVQLFSKEQKASDDFRKINKKYSSLRFKLMMSFSFYRPLITFIQYAAIAVVFVCGLRFNMEAGLVVAFYLFIAKFFEPVQQISDQLVHIERSISSSERLFNLLDVEPAVIDKPEAQDVEKFNGKIEFRHVWFSYDNKNWVLKDVNFVINKGETCAFVGATGAGKTTILSLLVKSYVPQKGQILIDDVDINDIKVSSLRNGIGQMLQDVFLFSGTIKDNVTLFDEKFSEEEINSALSYVNADIFVNQLENKMNTQIVERGENFSAGQRQLLSFARTILHKPQILLLDEATANIDTETEILIQDSLDKIKSLGTMLVVAHRLSTIKNADQIICLKNGVVVEKGKHAELLKQKGYYYKLNELQFK